MAEKTFVIVTSIAGPNMMMRALAQGCGKKGWGFIVIGDQASPADFNLEGCDFYSLGRQKETGSKFAAKCPIKHYARKNIGYIMAKRAGATVIVETDDDNIPYEGFWQDRKKKRKSSLMENAGWVNMYRYFSEANIWPRGFPLERLHEQVPDFNKLPKQEVDCPIQQGLADENPDVDAVYRLTLPLPQNFRNDRRIAMGNGSWCPMNSQNTTWWKDAFELMYLPAYCSFRMTDIWRSFVAQRISHANGWWMLFHEATMRQERNEHNLLKDFKDEIPGYLNNDSIKRELESLKLLSGQERIGENMRLCYQKLVEMGLVPREETELLNAWLLDIGNSR